MANMDNLKPFTGGDDPRRQNGRKVGSKNVITMTRELLESDVDFRLPINQEIKDYLGNNNRTSYMQAITLSMLVKAINGDVRAATWITDRYDKTPDPDSIFQKTDIVFSVVPSRCNIEDES